MRTTWSTLAKIQSGKNSTFKCHTLHVAAVSLDVTTCINIKQRHLYVNDYYHSFNINENLKPFPIYYSYFSKTTYYKVLDHNIPTSRRMVESIRHLRHFLQRRFVGSSSVPDWSCSSVCLKCALEKHILFLYKSLGRLVSHTQYNACINSLLFLSSAICCHLCMSS